MVLYLRLWPYMIYNPLFMLAPPLAVKSMTKTKFIPKDTYKKIQGYKNKQMYARARNNIRG